MGTHAGSTGNAISKKMNIPLAYIVILTYHAAALGKLFICLGLGYERLYLLLCVVTGIEVGPDHRLDDLGIVGQLGHNTVLHVLQT